MVAVRSKALVFGQSVLDFVGSNTTNVAKFFLLYWLLCVVRKRFLRQADHSSKGVLPTTVRRCVWSINLKEEEKMARAGQQRHRKKST